MSIVRHKPTSPGRRQASVSSFQQITRKKPHKPLTKGKTSISGRNSRGRITVRFRGGGHKRRLRCLDFKRDKVGIAAKVASIEYDPNRTARIALLHYVDGEKRYMLAPKGVYVGQMVQAGQDAPIHVGNHLPLANIPLGTQLHNIEMRPGKGGQLVRSAGAAARLVAREGDYATLRMPSGEVRRMHVRCGATIGEVGHAEHELIAYGKAGRRRWLGRRPHNRGVSMNPVDHPLGGGEGRSSGGRHPVTPWGVPTKGHRTRHNKRTQNQIIKRRR
ncbi:MAG: 50S ribosomal protein L2 [Myxococcota bacterium]